MSLSARVAPALLAALLVACGGASKVAPTAQTAARAPANPAAVAKMVSGVQAARDPSGRTRAITLLREALAIDPRLWEAHFDLGVVLAETGDLAGAEERLAAASKLAPDVEDVAVALAEVRRRRGENKPAADALADFVQAHPNADGARMRLVAALRESGQHDKATAQAREVLARKPGDPAALAELSLCHLARGEKDTAALLSRQAVDAGPKSAAAQRAAGLVALANGDDALAFQHFRRASEADPKDTTARLNVGAVLLRAGAYAKAEEQFRAILALDAEDGDAAVGLAASLRGEADAQHGAKLQEAETLLEKVLERDPHNVAALFNLGVLRFDFLKRPADALALFKRFLADAPSDHPMRAEAERYASATSTALAPAPPGQPAQSPATKPQGGGR